MRAEIIETRRQTSLNLLRRELYGMVDEEQRAGDKMTVRWTADNEERYIQYILRDGSLAITYSRLVGGSMSHLQKLVSQSNGQLTFTDLHGVVPPPGRRVNGSKLHDDMTGRTIVPSFGFVDRWMMGLRDELQQESAKRATTKRVAP